MINKELDSIMSEYVDKAKEFCECYKKEVLAKEHTTFSCEVAKIYSNLEDELWRLKDNTEELLHISNDRFINREINNRNNHGIISSRIENVNKEIESVQADLNSIHRFFLYRYGANIAEGLAEQWGLEAVTAGFEVVKSGVKYVIKGGC